MDEWLSTVAEVSLTKPPRVLDKSVALCDVFSREELRQLFYTIEDKHDRMIDVLYYHLKGIPSKNVSNRLYAEAWDAPV